MLNGAAYDYMRNQGLPAATIARLKAGWQAHPGRLGFNASKVARRQVSAGIRSAFGRDCRDAVLSLARTCDTLGIAVWDYPDSRFNVAGAPIIEPLGDCVSARLRPA